MLAWLILTYMLMLVARYLELQSSGRRDELRLHYAPLHSTNPQVIIIDDDQEGFDHAGILLISYDHDDGGH